MQKQKWMAIDFNVLDSPDAHQIIVNNAIAVAARRAITPQMKNERVVELRRQRRQSARTVVSRKQFVF